jgi:hypothetical protein
MLTWTIKIAILSLIFIFLVHHLISFFTSVLTVPKIKDLVNSPNQKYQHILDTITNTNTNYSNNSYTAIDLLPPTLDNSNTMKDELKSFLKKQLSSDSTEISAL